MRGSGCRKCYDNARTETTKSFKERAIEVHGTRYDYRKTVYKDSRIKVAITCPTHGVFYQSPSVHLRGGKCRKCADENNGDTLRLSTLDFIDKAKKIHGTRYMYIKVKYIGTQVPIIITCKIHGDFAQTANSHLSGSGCSKCTSRGYSKMAIAWINDYAHSHRLKNVQHALSVGEYRIPGTRFTVDGFHARSNTVFEFHGDDFHGNPDVHKPMSKPNPYSPLTAKQLYRKTKDREARILSLGYNLVVMWENDYLKRK